MDTIEGNKLITIDEAAGFLNVKVKWFRPKLDLKELKRLHLEEGWLADMLAVYFEQKKNCIYALLKKLKNH